MAVGAATRVIVLFNKDPNYTNKPITVKAGNKIKLSAILYRSVKSPESFKWTIDGEKFINFNEDAPSYPLTPFVNSVELIKENLIFYWSDSAVNRVVKCDNTVSLNVNNWSYYIKTHCTT